MVDEDRYSYYERRVQQMLSDAGVEPKASYKPCEVQVILNVSDNMFKILCEQWEPPTVKNRQRGGIESYFINTHRRVPHHALVEYLAENNNYERKRGMP